MQCFTLDRVRAGALLALCLQVAVGAGAAGTRAESVPGPPRVPAAGLSDLDAGRLLIRAGRLEHARAFLEQARPGTDEERIERLFLLGRIETRLGNSARAAEHFEAILSLRPELTRVRLEAARAWFLAGRDDRARRHFDATLEAELPASVEAAVEGFLRRIDARRPWTLSASASMLPEARRPDREVVLIGGVPFRLDEEARSSSGAGVLVSAGASYAPRFTDDLRGVLGASGAAKLYRRSSWNEVTAYGDFGLARLSDRGSAAGGVRLGRRWVGGDPDQRSVGPWVRMRWRLGAATRLDADMSAGYREHDAREARDGWRFTAAPRLVHVANGRTSFEVEPVLEFVEAKRGHHASRLAGLGTTMSRTFAGGISVSLRLSAHARRHAAPDPLFGRKRIDRNVRGSVRLLHRSLRYGGFAPYVGYSFERNGSSIPVHEYRSHGVLAGFSHTF